LRKFRISIENLSYILSPNVSSSIIFSDIDDSWYITSDKYMYVNKSKTAGSKEDYMPSCSVKHFFLRELKDTTFLDGIEQILYNTKVGKDFSLNIKYHNFGETFPIIMLN